MVGYCELGEESPLRALTHVVFALIAAATSVTSIEAAFAQAGSAGGKIGIRGKSISGSEEETAPRIARKRPADRARPPQRRGEQAATLGAFDGSWSGMSVGSCIGRFGWKVQVTNGVISGGATGQITRSGATNGDMVVMGKHFLFRGVTRASGRASGTWTSRPNCSGSWTAFRS
jgi:hypothetical protein